jgi:hypothetical protein
MVSISGPCAFSTSAASFLTSELVARSAASSAIATACRWWGIMPCAKVTSASLNARAAPGDGVEPAFVARSVPPQPVRASAAARTVAARARDFFIDASPSVSVRMWA